MQAGVDCDTMIPRKLETQLHELAGYYPVTAFIGPRQSGKTTLCRMVFPDRPYVSFEALDIRAFATEDPRGFLANFRDGAILDEVQRVPDLLSYLQPEIDDDPAPGRLLDDSPPASLACKPAQTTGQVCKTAFSR